MQCSVDEHFVTCDSFSQMNDNKFCYWKQIIDIYFKLQLHIDIVEWFTQYLLKQQLIIRNVLVSVVVYRTIS